MQTRHLTPDELSSVGIQASPVIRSRNLDLLRAALANVHRPSVAAALIEIYGHTGAKLIAREIERIK